MNLNQLIADEQEEQQRRKAWLEANKASFPTESGKPEMLEMATLSIDRLLAGLVEMEKILAAAARAAQSPLSVLVIHDLQHSILGVGEKVPSPTHQIVDFGPGPQDHTLGYPFQGTEAECISWLERHQEVRTNETNRYCLQDIADTAGGIEGEEAER